MGSTAAKKPTIAAAATTKSNRMIAQGDRKDKSGHNGGI
jgi:hypothetical protein